MLDKLKHYLLAILVLSSLAGSAVVATWFLSPKTFTKLAITFHLQPNAKAEKERLEKIELLPISDAQRNLLINRTIFLGANTRMVHLALGDPIQVRGGRAQENVETVESWVYLFENENRPTILEFQDNRLAKAYKVSAHKLNLSSALK